MCTKHFEERCIQRNFDDELIEIVLKYGRVLPKNPDRLIFSKKELNSIPKGTLEKSLLIELEKKIPICIVRTDKLVTVFRVSRRIDRSKIKK